MDRTAWIAVTFCIIGMMLWYVYVAKTTPPPKALPSPTPATSVAAASATPIETATPAPSATPQVVAEQFVEKIEILRNNDEEVRLTNRGGAISEIVLLNHTGENGQPIVLNSKERMPIGAIVEQPVTPTFSEFAMARQADGSVQLEQQGPDKIDIRKTIRFAPDSAAKDNFVLQFDLDFRNESAQPITKAPFYITLGSARPIHSNDYPSYTQLGWCVNGKAKFIDVNWFAEQNSFFGLQKRPARPMYEEKIPVEWAGVSSQFFTTLLTPLNAKASGVWGGHRFEVPFQNARPAFGLDGALIMPGFEVKPGTTSSLHFQLYAGPKLYHRLAELQHDEAEVMNFGIFKLISQALLNLLNLLHNYLGNYAAAILALTTIVKLTLWPLQNKANRSMRQMSALSPKIQELRDKYKDDPTRMNQEVMKLYKDYGINPASGCLPMFIQIPIFFGLFTMLRQAVELRNASFLWVRDLSQPDTVGYLFGFPVNIIPLLMAGTQIWLMQMTPKTGDPTQRRVMMFTPIIFVVFCYNFAAALALYYTAQNLLSIVQFYQNKRQPVPTLEKVQKRKR